MPFLGTLAAPIIGALGGIGSSLIGAKMGNVGPTKAQQSVLDLDQANAQAGQNLSGSLVPQGQSLLSGGAQAMQQPINYWGSILSGNRSLATSALAPDISQIGQGYQAANQTSAALMPRGGPSAAFNAELPYQQQRDVSTLFQQARPAAATAMAGAGGQLLNQGSGILGQAANALYASTAAGRDILQQQQQMQEANQKRGSSIGAGLFSQFQQYGIPALKKQFPSIFGMMTSGDPWNTSSSNPNNSGGNSGTGAS